MLGNFTFHNPTKLYFGENSLENLSKELGKYGEKVMLVYGGGSIRKNGIYDAVLAELRKAGKQTVELSGVMPNPTIEKVMEGVALARKEAVDFILAVGGGSVCDYCKAVAGSAYCEHDPWEYYFNNFGEMTCRWIAEIIELLPVLAVLGDDGTAVHFRPRSRHREHAADRNPAAGHFPILNPVYTYTVPRHHTVAGIYDIMSHILEQYLSGTDDNTTDYIAEGLMRSLVVSSRKVLGNPEDYEARSNIMWTATWALNGLLACGKPTDWMVHMLGQAVAAYTDATHGHTLSAVSGAYYRLLISRSKDAEKKFCRLAENVWGISSDGKTEKDIAVEGLLRMEEWMRDLGLAMNITACGADVSQLEGMADACPINESGYVILTREDVIEVLRQSL